MTTLVFNWLNTHAAIRTSKNELTAGVCIKFPNIFGAVFKLTPVSGSVSLAPEFF